MSASYLRVDQDHYEFIHKLLKTSTDRTIYDSDTPVPPEFKTIYWSNLWIVGTKPLLNEIYIKTDRLFFTQLIAVFETPMSFRRLIFRNMDSNKLILDGQFLVPAMRIMITYGIDKTELDFGRLYVKVNDILDYLVFNQQRFTKQMVRLLPRAVGTELKLAPIEPGGQFQKPIGLAQSFRCLGTSSMVAIANEPTRFEQIPRNGLSYIDAFLTSEFDSRTFISDDIIRTWAKLSKLAAKNPKQLNDPAFLQNLRKGLLF